MQGFGWNSDQKTIWILGLNDVENQRLIAWGARWTHHGHCFRDSLARDVWSVPGTLGIRI